jgi:hypothetical protein
LASEELQNQKPTAHCVTGWACGGEGCRTHNPTTPNPKNPTTKKREWIINRRFIDAVKKKI